ncbi:putative spermidine/putrescine transport system permease protein [Cryobacterium mesophilum]|uniref:Sugar ABC transporter permease n=1 Tax=Terrimesophilobacter mesophilus TaxID=433647 RepID=A0A4R8VB04_9MICO|nr:sugar ABC transporter permease [Terrimesophilobacter mesophilus]MBB5633721.1 putative spermidine/putrescine transport system permease protein [Terrimesophilobacter mesophilus]TFB80404.1 sugar ABC transporter permease [Terrimesophilobacter mesophilus]
MPSLPTASRAAAESDHARALSRVSLRHRLAERGLDRIIWLAVPGFLFVVALFIYPAIFGVVLSFQPNDDSGFFGNYIEFFTDAYLFDTIGNTFRIALPAALINVLASIPLALVMRGKVRGKRAINTILIIPISLGTVLVAEGLLTYLGPQGWFNRILMGIGLIQEPVRLTHNIWGVIISLIITGFPFAFLLTLSYISGINPKMEEAASTLGAGRWQQFYRVTLPLLAPGLAITFCLTFVLAFSVFPSAVMLGNPAGDSHVLSVAAAQTAFQKYDFPLASTISVITAVVELLVVALVLLWRSRLYRGSSAGGKG